MKKLLIANRGEIALRIMKTCREMGIGVVAVASEADRHAAHARAADEVHLIGPAQVNESYLRGDRIIEAAKAAGAEAIHPGFGFLSENADFATAVRSAGLIFIGPEAEVIRLMGSKQVSKETMAAAGVPVIPGYHGQAQGEAALAAEAERIGFPLLIKASAGGGGKGMRVVEQPGHFGEALAAVKREALSAFGDATVLLEKYLERTRHVEIQVFGDQHGNLVHLFERECSIQRRHQKILEETPSPALTDSLRVAMAEAALRVAATVNYSNAGTVEFMLDEYDRFYFLEMNTRLQVEHPITEMLTGIDLVRWQIEVAQGQPLPMEQARIQARGHAIEVRVYAEDPSQQFLPQTGKVIGYREPRALNVRVDSGIGIGDEVGIFYDPMIAKVIAWAPERELAVARLDEALSDYQIHGVRTNIAFLKAVLSDPEFQLGHTFTNFLAERLPRFESDETHLDLALALAAKVPSGGLTPVEPGTAGPIAATSDPWQLLTGWRAIR